MATPTPSSEVPQNSGAAARSEQVVEEEQQQEPEVTSSVHGDGGDTGSEDELIHGGGEDRGETSQAEKEKKKKKEGPPKGRWVPSTITQAQIDQLIEDGRLAADSGYRIPPEEDVPPNPDADECVIFKACFDRGFSLPPSKFLLEILTRYGAQLHNFPPNSILAVSAFVSLCEGYLGIEPTVELFEFF